MRKFIGGVMALFVAMSIAFAGVAYAVDWPFGAACWKGNYRYDGAWGHWTFFYDHSDGRINYYRVLNGAGEVVGDGWSSCREPGV